MGFTFPTRPPLPVRLRGCSAPRAAGLVVPSRRQRLPALRPARLNQLRSLAELRSRFRLGIGGIAFAARLRREPSSAPLSMAGFADWRLGSVGSSGSNSSTSGLGAASTRKDFMAATQRYDLQDLALADEGRRRIDGPTGRCRCSRRSGRFEREPPLAGHRISACLHVRDRRRPRCGRSRRAGADVVLCASDPLSTQDDVAAALVAESTSPSSRSRARTMARTTPTSRRPSTTAASRWTTARHDRRPPLGATRAARRDHRRHRGDDDRRDPAQGPRSRGRLGLPGSITVDGAECIWMRVFAMFIYGSVTCLLNESTGSTGDLFNEAVRQTAEGQWLAAYSETEVPLQST